MNADTISQTVLPLKAVSTCPKVITPDKAQAMSARKAMVPSSTGCRMKPMTVPRKMVNRYQAAGVRPSGTGMTQPDKATLMRLDDALRVTPSPALYGDLKALLGPSCLV